MPQKLVLPLGMINYFLFFGPYWIQQSKHRREVQARREKFESSKLPEDTVLHRCVVCGITEVTNPKADFRVADDDQEYCTDHLPRETAGTI